MIINASSFITVLGYWVKLNSILNMFNAKRCLRVLLCRCFSVQALDALTWRGWRSELFRENS